jgi:hypothetical protein
MIVKGQEKVVEDVGQYGHEGKEVCSGHDNGRVSVMVSGS